MSFERIFGLLFTGFACKIYAAGLAVWMAYQAATFIKHAFAAVGTGLLH